MSDIESSLLLSSLESSTESISFLEVSKPSQSSPKSWCTTGCGDYWWGS
jgi:hypothetical protein